MLVSCKAGVLGCSRGPLGASRAPKHYVLKRISEKSTKTISKKWSGDASEFRYTSRCIRTRVQKRMRSEALKFRRSPRWSEIRRKSKGSEKWLKRYACNGFKPWSTSPEIRWGHSKKLSIVSPKVLVLIYLSINELDLLTLRIIVSFEEFKGFI